MTSSTPSGPAAVVVGVDGSSHSNVALSFAAELALREHRPLHLLHAYQPGTTAYSPVGTVLDWSERHDLAEQTAGALVARAAESARTRRPTLVVTEVTTAHDPRQALLDAAEDAALVVVGSRGLGPMERLALGSVSTWISQHASCPVLVVRAAPSDRAAHIVAATDGTEASAAAMEFAFTHAARHQAPLTVLRCFPDESHGGYGLTGAADLLADDLPGEQATLSTSLASLIEAHPDVEVTSEVRHSSVTECLLDASRQASLVVVGSHHRSILGALVHGAVSRNVVEHARCTVAVVPAGWAGDTTSR